MTTRTRQTLTIAIAALAASFTLVLGSLAHAVALSQYVM